MTFENIQGETVTVGSGDEVVLGGGGSHVEEDGIANQEYISRREWLSPPEPSCVTDERFSVSSVEHGSDQQPCSFVLLQRPDLALTVYQPQP